MPSDIKYLSLSNPLKLKMKFAELPKNLKFINNEIFNTALVFPKDSDKPKNLPGVNTLNNPNLFTSYDKGWKFFNN